MTHLQPSSGTSSSAKKPAHKTLAWVPVIFLVISALGFIDASYLAVEHYNGTPITCTLLEGCGVVTGSAYATILGIPVALLGALYYLAFLIGTVFYFDRKDERMLRPLAMFSIAGLAATLYFLFIQAFVLNAFCIYCLGSAFTSTVLFATGMWYLFRTRMQTPGTPAAPKTAQSS